MERDNIYFQLNKHSPTFASPWLEGLYRAATTIAEWPGPRACPRFEEACDLYDYEVRQIIYRGPLGKGAAYRVLFRVVADDLSEDFDVTILRVLYGGQLLTPS